MPRKFDWEKDLKAIEQLERFFNKYYRIPEFVKVGDEEIPFTIVKGIVERYLFGQSLMYWKRSKFLPQLQLARETLKLRMAG